MFRQYTAELHLQMFGIALSAHCADVVSPWGNNREDNIFPYADVPHRTRCVICERLKYFEFVGAAISRPPTWQILEQNRIGQTRVPMLRICHVPTGYHRISPHYVRWCIVGALRRRYFPMGEITGRLIAVELLSDRPRRSLDFNSLRGAPPYAVCAAELPAQKFRCANDTLY